MVNSCQDMEVRYTVKNVTKHFGRPYLLNNLDELNILVDEMCESKVNKKNKNT